MQWPCIYQWVRVMARIRVRVRARVRTITMFGVIRIRVRVRVSGRRRFELLDLEKGTSAVIGPCLPNCGFKYDG